MAQVTSGRMAGNDHAGRRDHFGVGLVAGTPVITQSGILPVEYLDAGERILTRDGLRSLKSISSRLVPVVRMIRVSASTLGNDLPREDMFVTPETGILVRDWRARALAGSDSGSGDRAVIPAARLVDGEFIRQETLLAQNLYRLELDAPTVIYAGGLEIALAPAPVRA